MNADVPRGLTLQSTWVDTAGPDGTGGGSTFLHTDALRRGPSRLIRSLRRASTPDPQNHQGNTPLHLAAEHGKAPMVAALLKAGADPLLKNAKGHTPLERALKNGFRCVLSFDGHPTFVSQSPGIDHTDGHVMTWDLLYQARPAPLQPLLVEALHDRHEVACLWLLAQGADPNMPDAKGTHPLGSLLDQLAWSDPPSSQLAGQTESRMVFHLLEAGADPLLPLKQSGSGTAADHRLWPLLDAAWNEGRLHRLLRASTGPARRRL